MGRLAVMRRVIGDPAHLDQRGRGAPDFTVPKILEFHSLGQAQQFEYLQNDERRRLDKVVIGGAFRATSGRTGTAWRQVN